MEELRSIERSIEGEREVEQASGGKRAEKQKSFPFWFGGFDC